MEVKELLKALEKEPNNPITLLSLGQLSMEGGSTDAGIRYFLRAAEMDGDNAPFFFNDLSTTLYISSAPEGGKGDGPGEQTLLRTLSFALNALGYLEGGRAKELIASSG